MAAPDPKANGAERRTLPASTVALGPIVGSLVPGVSWVMDARYDAPVALGVLVPPCAWSSPASQSRLSAEMEGLVGLMGESEGRAERG